jgi:hypothetical protein
MKRYQIILVCALMLIGTSCSSKPTNKKLSVLTVAVAGDHVFVGEAISFGIHGNFSISSITSPSINCTGRFRYKLRTSKGKATYSCDNDMSGALRIKPDGPIKGSGTGESPLGKMTTLFGYNLDQINELLLFPHQGQLTYTNSAFKLVYPNDPT